MFLMLTILTKNYGFVNIFTFIYNNTLLLKLLKRKVILILPLQSLVNTKHFH